MWRYTRSGVRFPERKLRARLRSLDASLIGRQLVRASMNQTVHGFSNISVCWVWSGGSISVYNRVFDCIR